MQAQLAQHAQQPIAVLDSGVGGLSVLQVLVKKLPNERFVFLADDAFMPYGDKSPQAIVERVMHLCGQLQALPCKALVLACNTATVAGVGHLRARWPNWPVVAIEPAVKPAARCTQTKHVAVLATASTISSAQLKRLIEHNAAGVTVHCIACPGLVEWIESNPEHANGLDATLQPALQPETLPILQPIVQQIQQHPVDVVVLGCTHYPFIAKPLQAMLGSGVQLLETAEPVALQLQRVLMGLNIQRLDAPHQQLSEQVVLYATHDPVQLKRKMLGLLGDDWRDVIVQPIS